jgi:rhodanese-related sulfurtransferase
MLQFIKGAYGMKKALIIIGVLVAVGAGVGIWLTHRESEPTSLPTGTSIYDVRTQDEYVASHISSAMLFPLTDIRSGKFPTVSKDSPVAVYDTDGTLAAEATTLLKKAGFTKVYDIGSIANVGKYGLSTVQ